MIARLWRGAVSAADADGYAQYVDGTGVASYLATDGNRAVYTLRRAIGERTEFVLLSLWESLEGIKAFAGDAYDQAVFYPEDEHYLLERDAQATHLDVVLATVPGGASDAVGWRLPGKVMRCWTSWTRPDAADTYLAILGEEVLPAVAARVAGYNGAYVLRGPAGGADVQFVMVTLFDSMAAVRAFAGQDHHAAHVPEQARTILTRFDERALHYEVLGRGGAGRDPASGERATPVRLVDGAAQLTTRRD